MAVRHDITEGAVIYQGDALEVLRQLPDESVQCVVASPPYWGLRDYGVLGQIGKDSTLILKFVQDRFARDGHGPTWLELTERYQFSGETIMHMLEAGLLRHHGHFYEPGPALESVTTRQLTDEERRNLEAGLPSSGEPPRAGYIWWTRGGVA